MSTPVVVLATQRSGTNLLRRTLASSEFFEDLDEVFWDREPFLFWKFRQELLEKHPELSFPFHNNQKKIFNLFMEHISQSSVNFSLIDIKYNSTHHFNPIWHSTLKIPYVLKLLAENNIPVIHLVRKNILETYVSRIIGNKLKIWVVDKNETFDNDIKIKIDINHMLYELKMIKKETNFYRECLVNLTGLRYIELSYEDLIDKDGSFADQVINEICELLNVDTKFEVIINTQKMGLAISKTVKNYENEVVPVLTKYGYSYLV